jgi:hypothetical protein
MSRGYAILMYSRWKDGEKLSSYDYQKYVVPFLKKDSGTGYKNLAYYSSTYRWS